MQKPSLALRPVVRFPPSASMLLAALCLNLTFAESAASASKSTRLATPTASDLPSTLLDGMEVRERREQADALALDEPSQTGSRLGLELRDLPASVSVVTQEAIRISGARTALEAVENAVGMIGTVGVGSIPSYSTRGFTSGDITIMRDGIRQNTASQSSRPLDSFLFDRIEVLKGPASLLYGEGAIGGAVNYVSKQASDRFEGEALLSAGYWDSYSGAFGAGGPTAIESLSFRADLSRRQERGFVDRSNAQYDAIGGELRWQPTVDTSVRFSGTVLDDDTESYYGTPLVYDAIINQNGEQLVRRANTATDRLVNARIEPASRRENYNHLDNFARARNSFWRVIAETRLSPAWTLRNETYAATQDFDWQNTESTVWNPATRLVDRSSFFLIFRDDLQLGNRLDLRWDGTLRGRPNKFLIGTLYDDNDQDRNSGQVVPGSPTPASVPLTGFNPGFGPTVVPQKTVNVLTRNRALYIENLFELTDRLALIGGMRYDRIDIDRTSFIGAAPFSKRYEPLTGRLGAMYTLRPQVNVYASYSYAAQPVSQLVSLGAAQDEFSLQKGRQFEVGLKASGWDGRADATFALFDIEKRDLLTSSIVDGIRFNSQIGAQVSQGAELELSLRPAAGWRLAGQFAWNWAAKFKDFNENLGTGVISRSGNTPPNVPDVIAGVSIVREWADWRARAALRHVGERQANNNNGIQLDAYTTLDASLTRRWEQLSVTLRGRNLTDREYAPAAASGGLMLRLADPRSAELGLEYVF